MGGNTINTGEFNFVELEFPHPDYDSTTNLNDVMLVKLESPSSAPIQQINFDASAPPDGSQVTAIGFGDTSEGGSNSFNLLEIQSNTVTFETCNDYYGLIDEDKMICMGGVAGIDTW